MALKGQSKKKSLKSKKEDESKKQESITNSVIKKTQSLNSEKEKIGNEIKSTKEDLKDKINDFDNNKTEVINKIDVVPKGKTRLSRAAKISKENIVSEPELSNTKLSKNSSKTKNDELVELNTSKVELTSGRKKCTRISTTESITSIGSGDSVSTSTRRRKINNKDLVGSSLSTIGETETLQFKNNKKDDTKSITSANNKKNSESPESEVSIKLKRKPVSKLKKSKKLVDTSEDIESTPKDEIIPGLKMMELKRKSMRGCEAETKGSPLEKSRTSRAQLAKKLNKEVAEKETDKNNNISNTPVKSIPEGSTVSSDEGNSIKPKPRKSSKVVEIKEDKTETKSEIIPGMRLLELVKNRKSLINSTNNGSKKSVTTKAEEETKKLNKLSVPVIEKRKTLEIDSNEIISTTSGQRLLRNKLCIDIDKSPVKTVPQTMTTLKRSTPVLKYNLNDTTSPAAAQIKLTDIKIVQRKSSGLVKQLDDVMGRIEAKIPGLSDLQQRKSSNLEKKGKPVPLKSVKKSISSKAIEKIPGLNRVAKVEVPKLTAQTINEKTGSVSQKRKLVDEDVYEPSVKKSKIDDSNHFDACSLPSPYINKDLLGFDVFSPIHKADGNIMTSNSNNIFSTPTRNVNSNNYQFITPQPTPLSSVRDFMTSTPKNVNDPMDIMRKTPVNKNFCSRRRSILNTTHRNSTKSFIETPRRQNVKFDETVEYKEIVGNSFDSDPMDVDVEANQAMADDGQDVNNHVFVFGNNRTDESCPKVVKPFNGVNLGDLFGYRDDDVAGKKPQSKHEMNTGSLECQDSAEGDKKAACSIM